VIAGLVLAAGASRRLGRNKLLLPYRGETILSATVSRLLAAPLDRAIVVLGHAAAEVGAAANLPLDPRLLLVANPGWEEGMASSLRVGLEAAGEAEAVVIALGDQPNLDPQIVADLLSAHRDGARLALAVLADAASDEGVRPGHPVLFARALFPELLALRGDVGAREVVKRHWRAAAKVVAKPLQDVDTEDDYRALLEREPRR
jgi:CTP:molybdopterin cytidylyltransferase MocA